MTQEATRDDVSGWLDRYGPAIVLVNSGMAFMAAHFAVVVWSGGAPVTPEIYGAAVSSVPAIVWAGLQFGAHSLAVIGSMRGNAAITAAGGIGGVCVHGSFAALAGLAEQGTLLQAGAMWVTLPLCISTLFAGVGGLTNGR